MNMECLDNYRALRDFVATSSHRQLPVYAVPEGPAKLHAAAKHFRKIIGPDETGWGSHTRLVELLHQLIDHADVVLDGKPQQVGAKIVKDALFFYAAAMEFGGDHKLFFRALKDHSRDVREGALLGLRIWAHAGDCDAISLLRGHRDACSLERLRKQILKGLPPMGDNAEHTEEARDEIDRLLAEKAKADQAVEDALDKVQPDGKFTNWTPFTFGRVPSASLLGLAERVLDLRPSLTLSMVEALQIGDPYVVQDNNLNVKLYPGNIRVIGDRFWFVLDKKDDEVWSFHGAAESFLPRE